MKIPFLLRTLLIVLLFCNSFIANGQNVLWAKKGISEGFENGNGIVTDDSGNVYVTGQTEFSAVYDSYILNSWGSHDILAGKYSSNGNIKWIHNAGGRGGDVGHAIGVDAVHNSYIIGEYEDTADFSSGIKIKSYGANDIFIAKYNIGGNITWAKGFGSPGNDKGLSIIVTPSGDCYMTGYFSSTTDFGGKILNSIGGYDIFVIKTNSAGEVLWAKRAGGEGNDKGNGIALDASGNVYVTGTFYQAATFNNVTISAPTKTGAFLAKFDSTGQVLWAKGAGAGSCCDTTKSNAISLDEKGNIFITGYYKNVTAFGSYNFTSPDTANIFIVKYNPQGTVLWAKQGGGIDEDESNGIVIDTLNHLAYITGHVRDEGYFDSLYFKIVGYKDAFIAAYDMDGNIVWLKTYGGHYRDVGLAITVDNRGNIYSTGLFNDIAKFDTLTLTGFPNQPWADFYVNKISPAMAILPTTASTNLSLRPGHCSDLNLTFISGSGNKRIVVAHEGSPVSAIPQNGTSYSASASFGNGSNLGNNNFVVYNGTGNNFSVTNLTPGATYYFSVFEYNGFGIASSFLTNNPATGSATTLIYPINLSSLKNTICDGESVDIHASGSTSYSWTPLNNLINISDSVVSAIPHTTTTYKVSGNNAEGCYSEGSLTINVNPLPVVNFSQLTPVCMNNPDIILTGGTPAGGVYSGAGINGNQFSPMMSGSGIIPLTYEYTDVNGCAQTSQTMIEVYSMPGTRLISIPSVCDNESPMVLRNGTPSGGTYSGVGINGSTFDPSIGQGTYQITYTVTSNHGCTETATNFIEVKQAPVIDLGHDLILCEGNSTTLNAGTGFSSYSWSTGETTSSIVVDSSGVGLGVKNIFLIVANSYGCRTSDIIQIRFDLCAGIDPTVSELKNISVSPNPFNNKITLNTSKVITVCIYDICGKLIDKQENVFGKIEIGENLNHGVYFIDIVSGSTKKVFTVVKSGM